MVADSVAVHWCEWWMEFFNIGSEEGVCFYLRVNEILDFFIYLFAVFD